MNGRLSMKTEGPGYWMYEQGGVLRPAIAAYLHGQALTPHHIGAIRAYFRQWMVKGDWRTEVDLLSPIDRIMTRDDIDNWLSAALDEGIDPL